MATVLTQQVEWSYRDFPHNLWPAAYVEVNGEVVIPRLVEFGQASTGQPCCIVTFDDGSRLDVWLDPDFPRRHLKDYAVWNKSPYQGLTLSTCPEWRTHRCNRCRVKVEVWNPPDQVSVDLKFCERTDHKRLNATPHAHIIIRTAGIIQKRLGVEA